MYSNAVCSAPNSATVFVAAASLISAITTKPPPSTIPLTTSFPIPFAPPVTIATFPEKFIKSLPLICCLHSIPMKKSGCYHLLLFSQFLQKNSNPLNLRTIIQWIACF